jgi:hypothetical protein
MHNPATMYETETTTSTTTPIRNKGFMMIHDEFQTFGWQMIRNENALLVYNRDPVEHPYDEFIIRVEDKRIMVTVPVVNSIMSYTCGFGSYFAACEFISFHLRYFEENNKRTRVDISYPDLNIEY